MHSVPASISAEGNRSSISALLRLVVGGLCALIIVLSGFVQADAATLTLSPVTGADSYGVGTLFSVNVIVSTSQAESMNAVSGTVLYPKNLLELVSVDKIGSIINFWIGEPVYSNATGQAQFEGGVYNPGFTGAQGKIVTMLFRAKAAGTADISFENASILANDGLGTNILSQSKPVRLSIRAAVQEPRIEPGVTIAVRSATHPDQSVWYASNMALFTWTVPAGVTAIRTSYDQNSQSTPTQSQSIDTPETTVTLTDGTWYFHIQGRDAKGWGPVTHYRVQIDMSAVNPPVFDRFPALLTEGDVLLISGSAVKNSTVKLYLRGGSGYAAEQSTRTGEDGRFQAVWNAQLENDTYALSADVTTSRGLISKRSADRPIMVQPTTLERVTKPVLNYALIFAVLVGIAFLCALWTWYLLHGFGRFRKKIKADVRKTNQLIHVEFKKLLERAHSRRKLTAEEERMMSIIRENIHEAEEEIEKDVKEIGQ
ncbi:MAG: cohesin domain-containing protein [Patescibacteria group bacterium]